MKTYSSKLADWLHQEGYTHCFFVAGGNIMHAINAFRLKFIMIPFVHESALTIACEYFNLSSKKRNSEDKSFCLVTAGPGITNAITGIAGSHIESRELLIIGGQVKTSDLSDGLRQKGIQEINGVDILRPITKESVLLTSPINRSSFTKLCQKTYTARPGSVFIEIPLDVQGSTIPSKYYQKISFAKSAKKNNKYKLNKQKIYKQLKKAKRPIILLGGGVQGHKVKNFEKKLLQLNIPVQTTWNGIDLVDSMLPIYFGRPNTWGQRYANLIIQQADLIISIGSRLGLQQTGFNWTEFGKNAHKIMVDIDEDELSKENPKVHTKINSESTIFLNYLFSLNFKFSQDNWIKYCKQIKTNFPLNEASNVTRNGYIDPYLFSLVLSQKVKSTDVIIPCSSGSANTTLQQSFLQKKGQIVMNTKGMASMGYGLPGAIGAALATPKKRTILIEGDGGFVQNMQELGTLKINKLNIKIFIFFDNGYASIRMTQMNYFDGAYVGCDEKTGLGMPKWEFLAKTFDLNFVLLDSKKFKDQIDSILNYKGGVLCIVPIDPEQTYYPKITSRITKTGDMESNPLHKMTPPISKRDQINFEKYIY